MGRNMFHIIFIEKPCSRVVISLCDASCLACHRHNVSNSRHNCAAAAVVDDVNCSDNRPEAARAKGVVIPDRSHEHAAAVAAAAHALIESARRTTCFY